MDVDRFFAAIIIAVAILFAAPRFGANARYEIVAPTPRGTIVFDKKTGETFVTPPLRIFVPQE